MMFSSICCHNFYAYLDFSQRTFKVLHDQIERQLVLEVARGATLGWNFSKPYR